MPEVLETMVAGAMVKKLGFVMWKGYSHSSKEHPYQSGFTD